VASIVPIRVRCGAADYILGANKHPKIFPGCLGLFQHDCVFVADIVDVDGAVWLVGRRRDRING